MKQVKNRIDSPEHAARQTAMAKAKCTDRECPVCKKTLHSNAGAFRTHRRWCNPANPVARFWAKVDKRGPEDCWLWQGQVRWDGYGRFVTMRKPQWTHRYSWELHNGRKLVKGEMVLHACGNATCCNPSHLSLGTHQENMADPKRVARFMESMAIAKELSDA